MCILFDGLACDDDAGWSGRLTPAVYILTRLGKYPGCAAEQGRTRTRMFHEQIQTIAKEYAG